MKFYFFVFIVIFLSIYSGICYYIGLRGWQSVGSHIPFLNIKIYWLLFWVTAFSYVAARLAKRYLPGIIDAGLTTIGAYWMAAMLYFIILLLTVDLVRLIDRWTGFLPDFIKQSAWIPLVLGSTVLVLVAGILAYGSWNAQNIRISRYDLKVDKKAGDLKQLRIAAVSDIHLGTLVGRCKVDRMVEMINGLKPDVVLMPGDIIDEDIEYFVDSGMLEAFRHIKARYGVYASLGNHEYFSGSLEKKVGYFQAAGINVLRDKGLNINGSFNIVGREDKTFERMSGARRRSLASIMGDLDRTLPAILLDHQPIGMEEASREGVDLQLSGHTHKGQLFPIQLITGRIFENDWGYLKKNNMHMIVTSGFGTWGPPVRIGNSPEIVDVVLHFV